MYQWAYLHMEEPVPRGGVRYLLIRPNAATGEPAYYRCWAPDTVSLAALVTVAGAKWSIEDSFQSGKGLTGVDEHQVRRYTSWARWTVLVMLAHAVPAIAAGEQPDPPEDTGLIPPTPRRDRTFGRRRPAREALPRRTPPPLVDLATTPPPPRQAARLPAAMRA
ncbi:hypothetical protein [Actinomadura nitritigenes]|uniref:hypothetical protein n=1 Tax=Actinomadura nitritigenes TaxID=134602 RepID=UPI003D90B3C5